MPTKDETLNFPVKGLHVTREVGQQPDDTTADCSNVVSRDSIAGRNRGGSRSGLSKYCAEQSHDGAVHIQMLEVIVDPDAAALVQNFTTPEDDWIEHPRFPALIPPHGAPWQPSPNAGVTSLSVTLHPASGAVDVTVLTITLTGPTNGTATGVTHKVFNNLAAGSYTLTIDTVGDVGPVPSPTLGSGGGTIGGDGEIDGITIVHGETATGYIFEIDSGGVGSIDGEFDAVSDPNNTVGWGGGPTTGGTVSGPFSATGLSPGTYDLSFVLGAFPPTEQIDYASIVVGDGGGSIVNNGAFNCEIDGIVVAGGDAFSGYFVGTKPYP